MAPGEMTPRKVAQKLGIRLDAVYALIWAGRLPARKVNGLWRVPSAGVKERMKAQAARRDKRQICSREVEAGEVSHA
jgi:excisionase family DNA binding protein